METQTNIYSQFFDQVLEEIVRGNVEQGVGRLVGMLDGLALHHCEMSDARRVLNHHALHQLLLETPHYRRTKSSPSASRSDSPTVLKLGQATDNIAIMKALEQRRIFAERQITRAWDNGDKICLAAPTRMAIPEAIAQRDHPNITIVDDHISRLAALAASADARFDLICAPCAVDRFGDVALGQMLSAFRKLLLPQGTAIFSAVLPHHIGSGWARVSLNWRPFVHTEAVLRTCADAAGLSSQMFRDATGCLVWCMVQHAPHAIDRGSEHARY